MEADKAKIKLAITEQRYHCIMENVSCGIFIYDHLGTIIEINREGARIFGREKEKILGKDFRNFLLPEERPYATIQLQKIRLIKTINPHLCQIQQPDGKLIDVELNASYLEDDQSIIAVITDVTESNQLRSQAFLRDKLSTLGTLAAGLIHEINNPIMWVFNNLSYLKEKMLHVKMDNDTQNISAKMQEVIEESIQGTKRIRDLVGGLKGFVRLDKESPLPVDIHEALRTAIKIAEPQYKNFATIQTDFADNIPLLTLDINKLEQVFLNLIMNATQSMRIGKSRTNLIRIKTSLEKKRVKIDIADTGQGIPEDVLPKIFRPFFTTKAKGVGTGLGLSICYDIIRSLAGEITVKSDVGIGSVFSIYLPVQFVIPPDESVMTVAPLHTKKRILVISDQPALQSFIDHVLKSNYDVSVCNAQSALKLLANSVQDMDAIILEIDMPDVSGIDLHRYLLEQQAGQEKKIIFINSRYSSEAIRSFVATVKNVFIEKPFTQDKFQRAINAIFSNEVDDSERLS